MNTATADLVARPTLRPSFPAAAPRPASRIADTLALVAETVPFTRHGVQAGDVVYEAGEAFRCLHVVHAGAFKLVNASVDGREQVVGLQFKGDWLGFDGLCAESHGVSAVAMDTGEVWRIRYDDLLRASARHPELARLLHQAMGREMARDREALLSVCTLPADARVAGFLQQWALSLEERGLRTDQLTLRMTRAEIGNHLGMKLETVSRALSRLAREGIIEFCGTGRRDIRIPDVSALGQAGAVLQ